MTYPELNKLLRSVPKQYRTGSGANTAWLMSDNSFGELRLVTTATGFPLLFDAQKGD